MPGEGRKASLSRSCELALDEHENWSMSSSAWTTPLKPGLVYRTPWMTQSHLEFNLSNNEQIIFFYLLATKLHSLLAFSYMAPTFAHLFKWVARGHPFAHHSPNMCNSTSSPVNMYMYMCVFTLSLYIYISLYRDVHACIYIYVFSSPAIFNIISHIYHYNIFLSDLCVFSIPLSFPVLSPNSNQIDLLKIVISFLCFLPSLHLLSSFWNPLSEGETHTQSLIHS